MKKIFRLGLLAVGLLSGRPQVHAQSTTASTLPGFTPKPCAVTHSYLESLNLDGPDAAALVIPSPYPSDAIKTCGAFSVYYEDIRLGKSDGYNAPAGLGILRQQNLCAVLTYIQSVFDFTGVPAGGIRLRVGESSLRKDKNSQGLPFYRIPPGLHPTVNGYVADYVQTKVDPALSNEYHGEISIEFNSYMPYFADNDDAAVTAHCGMDLFTDELHMMAHVMGFFTWIQPDALGNFSTAGPFTSLDRSLHTSPDAANPSTINPFSSANLQRFVTPGFTFFPAAPFGTARQLWVNGLQPPRNHPMRMYVSLDPEEDEMMIHYDDFRTYATATRLSPGDFSDVVTTPYGRYPSMVIRKFSKGELEIFTDIIGYDYNVAYAITNATQIANRAPYSSRMNSNDYNHIFTRRGASEWLPADYTLVNNTGASLTIDLSTDGTLVDPDGDPISIYPGSLVNLRGCGDGINNHNLLSVNPAGTQITYTPRANFYGRAQFGVNLYDNKDKGGYVIYTIDVRKGNNVSLPADGNFVLNGSFEQGAEVRVVGTVASETINNSLLLNDNHQGRLERGTQMADAHPYAGLISDFGTLVKDSDPATEDWCNTRTATKTLFGASNFTFPAPWGGPGMVYPSPPNPAEHRYYAMQEKGYLMNLADTFKACDRYVLEFYIRKSHSVGEPPKDRIRFGFTDSARLAISPLVSDLSPTILAFEPTATTPVYKELNNTTWQKVRLPFNYCSGGPVSMLYLEVIGNPIVQPGSVLIDSVSIRKIPFSVTAGVQYPGGCKRLLVADPDADLTFGCGSGGLVTYTWSAPGLGVVGTGKELEVEPWTTTTYTVTADDGCGHTATATVTVTPCDCAPPIVLGSSAIIKYTSVSTIPATPAPGLYNIASDITISSNTTFTNTTILVNPGVTITVDNNARLTLDNCHLFICPDTNVLWKGIVLGGGINPGRITLRNNTLIEDAVTGISINAPAYSSGTLLIETEGAVFNRCMTGISISNDSASSLATYPYSIRSTIFSSRDLSSFSGYPLSWPTVNGLRALLSGSSTPAFSAATAPFALARNYVPVLCKNNAISYAGIRLNRVGLTVNRGWIKDYYGMKIGDVGSPSTPEYRNIFDHTGDGIYAYRSNLVLANSVFMNMSKPAPATMPSAGLPLPQGIGMRAIGDFMPYKLQLLPSVGVNDLRNVRFYDCVTGLKATEMNVVKSQGASAQSANTNYSATTTGFDISTSGYDSVLVTDDNRFSNLPNGLVLQVGSTTRIGWTAIAGNNFAAQPPAPAATSGSYFLRQGVKIQAAIMPMSGTVSKRIFVSDNNFQEVYNGIAISYIRNQQVTADRNTLNLKADPTGAVQYGISVLSSNTPHLLRNTVTTTTATSDKVRGFYLSANTGAFVFCNSATNTGRGIDFIGTQPLTRMLDFVMDGNLKGLALGGAIDPQKDSNNACWAQWMLPGGWSAGSGRYQTYAYFDSKTSPLYLWPVAWTDRTATPSINLGVPALFQFSSATGSLKIGQGGGHFGCEALATGEKMPTNPVSPTTTATLDASLPFFRFTEESQWLAQHQLWQWLAYDSLINDTLRQELQPFATNANPSRYAWLTGIEQALADGDVLNANNLMAATVPPMGPVTINPNLVISDGHTADDVVAAYLLYYNVYRDYLEADSLADSASIGYLSRLCPLQYGAVVYQARGLYSKLYGDGGTYDDDGLCGVPFSQGTYQYKTTADSKVEYSRYELYPNPNSGNFMVRQKGMGGEQAELLVYDALGRKVYRQALDLSNGTVSVQSGVLVPGLYLVSIQSANGTTQSFKVTINKD